MGGQKQTVTTAKVVKAPLQPKPTKTAKPRAPICPVEKAPSASPSPSPTITLTTSKKWVVPPRPKPGRKPSVDTPPNKRKAQNRAAQRAFRERRAQRVSELEEKLMQLAEEKDQRETELQKQLQQIIKDNNDLKQSLNQMTSQSMRLQPQNEEKTLADLDRALEERLPVPKPAQDEVEEDNSACGFCIKDSCLCASAGLRNAPPTPAAEDDDEVQPAVPLPHAQAQSKERRNSAMEIDFTEAFSKKSKQPSEKCGFCNEGLPCVCDEFQKKAANLPPLAIPSPPDSTGAASPSSCPGSPTANKLPTLHPDPQQSAAPIQVTIGSTTTLAYECTGTPGNCMQCQSDPMSTLFCTTLAAQSKTSTNVNGTFIPVSAAYQTLSRHKDFGRVDMGQLVGKLHTRGGQVEVSSVANVLRELDRRLYE